MGPGMQGMPMPGPWGMPPGYLPNQPYPIMGPMPLGAPVCLDSTSPLYCFSRPAMLIVHQHFDSLPLLR